MELPKKVRVGYKVYRVEDWDPAEAARCRHYGQTEHMGSIMKVDTSHGGTQAAETLLHELLHAAWSAGALQEVPKLEEEHVVSTLASVLTQVFQDSPEFIRFILSASREDLKK